ncbi:MAG: RelA/SpoT domain-containing protein [Gammaproteobacteria bacterium AqS3]|nr:RelA/SpoT domain-containing protein [Gammaproteobacteria bacterium AqS3]
MSTPPPEQIEAYIQEYKQLEQSYKQLSKVVRKELKKTLKESGVKYLKVQRRIKTVDSLRKKLEDPNKSTPIHSVTELSDLAGCRIILYHDYEIDFIAQKINGAENFFNIHDRGELKHSRESYNALHIEVFLKDQNIIFKDTPIKQKIKCEIQITTALYHLWAESAHDMIYKAPKYETKQDQQYQRQFEEWFRNEARNNMRKQFEIDKTSMVWRRFQNGIKIISNKNIQKIEKLKSNKDISFEVDLLSQYVRIFGNRDPEKIDLVSFIQRIIRQSNQNLSNSHDEEKYLKSIYKSCIHILRELANRNIQPEAALDELLNITRNENQEIKWEAEDSLLSAIEYATEHNGYFNVIHIGKQAYLSQKLAELPVTRPTDNMTMFAKVCGRLLSVSSKNIETTNPERTERGRQLLPASLDIIEIRTKAIQSLFRMFDGNTSSEVVQNYIVGILCEHLIPSKISSLSMEWKKAIAENIITVLDFYYEVIEKVECHVMLSIEKNINIIKECYGKEFIASMKKLDSYLANNIGYQIYKTCFKTELADHSVKALKIEEEVISQELTQHARTLNSNNLEVYLDVIRYMSHRYSRDGNQFLDYKYTFHFMKLIGSHQPILAQHFLAEKCVEPFYAAILSGIYDTKYKNNANETVSQWISRGAHLNQCIEYLSQIKNLDIKTVTKIYERSKNTKEEKVSLNLLQLIIKLYKDHKTGKNIAISCIQQLSLIKHHYWMSMNHPKLITLFFDDLEDSDWLNIFECFIAVPDFQRTLSPGFAILSLLAQKHPKIFIKLFKARIDYSNNLDPSSDLYQDYEPVSFRNNYRNTPISENIDVLASEYFLALEQAILEDSKISSQDMNRYRDLFINIFAQDVGVVLIDYIKSREEKAHLPFILSVIQNPGYFRTSHNVAKELLQRIPERKTDQRKLIKALLGSITTPVAYEINTLAEMYKEVIEEIQKWQEHKNETVQEFAKAYIPLLREGLAYEERNANKMAYGLFGKLSDEMNQRKRHF